jgi:hypothetical protein
MPITATANGKKFTFPDGTPPEQMGAAIDEFFSGQQSQQQGPAQAPVDELGSLFEPAPMAEQRMAAERAAKLEQLRQVNPAMAQQVEETGPLQAAGIGIGRGLTNIARGIGLAEQEDPSARQAVEALGEQQPAMGVGQAIGETAPFVAAGGPLTGLARSGLGQVAVGAGLGGAEETITSLGRGESAEQAALSGAIGAIGGGVAGRLFNYSRPTAKQQQIVKELTENPTDPDLAKFLVVDGKPQAQRALQKAAKQFGGREGNEFVAVAKNASDIDRKAIKKMVGITKKGLKDPVFRDANRVGDVVGDSLKNRVTAVKRINSEAGKRIDNVARTQLKGKAVDLSPARAKFQSSLQDLRVNFDPATGAVDFTGSALEGAGGAQARDLTKRMARILSKDGVDAADAHFAKRLIDQKVSFGTSDGGLAGQIDRSIKGLRSDINASIQDVSPAYKKANTKYSDTINALNNLQDAAGSKLDLESPKGLGVALRKLTSNAQSRDTLSSSLSEIDNVAKQYGVRFKDDIATQVNLANALEKRFKAQGSTTLRSQVGQGIADQALQSNAQRALGAAQRVGRAITDVSEDDVLNSILDIL